MDFKTLKKLMLINFIRQLAEEAGITLASQEEIRSMRAAQINSEDKTKSR
jgi:hypothetical protein